jgi:hypothetical protein
MAISVAALRRDVVEAFLGLFFRLVADAGTTGSADGATDDRAGRSGDRATHEGAGRASPEGTGAGTGLVVALGRLTGDRTGDRADAATDDGPDRATHRGADGGAAEGTGSGPDGLGPALLVLEGGAVDRVGGEGLVMDARVPRICRMRHLGLLAVLGVAVLDGTGGIRRPASTCERRA